MIKYNCSIKYFTCVITVYLLINYNFLFAQPIALKGGRVITISDRVIDNGTVLIDDGIIKAVGKNIRIPKDAEIIDISGKVVMPGLIDAMTYYGIDPKNLNETPWNRLHYQQPL